MEKAQFEKLQFEAAAYYAYNELPQDAYYAVSMYVNSQMQSWDAAQLTNAYHGALYAVAKRRTLWMRIALTTALVLIGLGLLGYSIPRPIAGAAWHTAVIVVVFTTVIVILQRLGWDIERNREGEWRRVGQELLRELAKRGVAC